MVGIVVILSAAIGTFVIGLGTDLSGDITAAVDIEDLETGTNGHITVGVTSIHNAEYINVTLTVHSGKNMEYNGTTGSNLESRLNDTGSSVTFYETGSGATTIRLLAVAVDGDREQIVLDREETI